MGNKKIKRIGFDLDGVIIGKPPFIPKRLIEWLYRGKVNKHLRYRYPGKVEKTIRLISHYPIFRPPINENVERLKRLSGKDDVELFAVTGRYGFLEKRTYAWFKENGLEKVFKKVYINKNDEEPHKFKEKVIKKIGLSHFIEDDELIVNYLKRKLKKVKLIHVAKFAQEIKNVVRPRILMGISYYYPNVSGLTIYAKNLAEELVKRGYETEVITSKHLKDLPEEERLNGVKVKRIWTPFIFGRGPIMPSYPLESYNELKDADIVNYHIPSFEAVFLCIWAKITGKIIVLTHHCDLSNWPGLINQISEKATYLSLLLSGYLADRIVVYTKDYADSSDYLSHFKKKLFYILPPVKVEKPQGKLKNKYKKFNYKIGFAGRIAKEKGIENLLNTIPILKKQFDDNFKLFLAGPGKEVIGGGNEKEIGLLLKKYKKYVVYLGSLDQKKMADFYQMLDVLILPSTEKIESFGFVQVEAMKLGCPVIASEMPGVRMPVRLSAMGETVKVGDTKDLAKKIIKVLKNKKKYLVSRNKIDEIFNYENTIDAYEKLFKSLS